MIVGVLPALLNDFPEIKPLLTINRFIPCPPPPPPSPFLLRSALFLKRVPTRKCDGVACGLISISQTSN